MAETLETPYVELNLAIREGEPASWEVTVPDLDWSGTYTAQVVGGDAVATLGFVATYAAPDTTIALTLTRAESLKIGTGVRHWAARVSSGDVRFGGSVMVTPEAVPVA